MKRIYIFSLFAILTVFAFAQVYKLAVTKNDGQTIVIPTDDISKIEFVDVTTGDIPQFDVSTKAVSVPYTGGEITFDISANCEWNYEVDNDKVSQVSRTADRLVLNFPAVESDQPATFRITFKYADKQRVITLQQDASPRADLLDIVFKEDGTAEDVSPLKHTVITKDGTGLLTYYNDIHKRYVANFRHSLGDAVTSGYYRVNYKANSDFINRIADGCTFESIIMLGDTDPANKEVKWFSSMQSGGIGFILPIHNNSNPGTKCMTFLPNISTTGASNWRWTYSNVQPEVGRYYHVVGVWNKEEGKSYIYINGVLSGQTSAPGNYVPVYTGAESFVIGGDAETNQTTCASAWNGDIVTARIYDMPMNAAQVAKLWDAASFDQGAATLAITDLRYLPECNIAPGYKFTIYGKGFSNGDVIELQQKNGSASFSTATTVDDSSATIVIPQGMQSGTYKIVLKRGTASTSLCAVNFTITDKEINLVAPKVIAHRGAHTGGATENSLAALRKAMDANYYGIELDVWITTDDRIVIHHDGVASGYTFSNCSYNEIKNIRLSNGETLPTLDSFIATFKEKMAASSSKLIVEIKTHSSLARSYAAVDKAMEMIENAGLKDRTEYIAFSYDVCRRIVSKDPNAIVGYLNGDRTPATVHADGIRSIDYNSGAFNNHPEWISQARDLGMITNVWTVNSAPDMLKFMGLGVDYITTDDPALLTDLCTKSFISK